MTESLGHNDTICVSPLRAGSVVADMEAIVPNDVTVTSSAASLSVGVLAMAGRDVIVAGQIGSVGVVVGNLTGECFCLHLTAPMASWCLPGVREVK